MLQYFASLKNTIIDSTHNGYGTELSDIIKTLDDPAERELRIFERPLSGIKINGQKIQYFKFISSLENKDCNQALKRILPKIDIEMICKIVDETPFISDLQKKFYKTMLRERKERILDFSYQKLRSEK